MNFFRSLLSSLPIHSQPHSNIDHSSFYWSWLSRQYQLFGDLMESAERHGVRRPLPTVFSATSTHGNHQDAASYLSSHLAASRIFTKEMVASDNVNASSGGTIVSLHHAGVYYQLAAFCAVNWRRLSVDGMANHAVGAAPQPPIIVDLLTKSYEQFKKHKQSRMTLYLAKEIADSHHAAHYYDMAIK